MAGISKTEKVQLHAPALEELCGGKDFSSCTGDVKEMELPI